MISVDAHRTCHISRTYAAVNGCIPCQWHGSRAFPTDYKTTGGMPPLKFLYQKGLGLTRIALREWAGLVAYRLIGRTDTLLPKG